MMMFRLYFASKWLVLRNLRAALVSTNITLPLKWSIFNNTFLYMKNSSHCVPKCLIHICSCKVMELILMPYCPPFRRIPFISKFLKSSINGCKNCFESFGLPWPWNITTINGFKGDLLTQGSINATQDASHNKQLKKQL